MLGRNETAAIRCDVERMDFIRYAVRRRGDRCQGAQVASLSAEPFQEYGKLRGVLG